MGMIIFPRAWSYRPMAPIRLELSTSLLNRFHRLKEIAGRARQAIKFLDNDRVTSANLIEHPLELWTIAGAGAV